MNKELVIQSLETGIEIALLEDKKLVELHFDNSGGNYNIGDLYLGKVKKIMPGLNAVFVDIGHEKDSFLHYTDLSPYFRNILKFTEMSINDTSGNSFDMAKFTLEPEIIKTGKMADVIQGKPNVLVQILKEPISTKGPRVSCEISLPGRFLVVTPFNNFVNVSRKIQSTEERKRLQKIIENIKPGNFGVIVRTAAEGQSTAELHKDLLSVIESWKNIQLNLQGAKAPSKILSEQNKTTSLLRDLLNDNFNSIIANDKSIIDDVTEYISKIAPGKEKIIYHYQNKQPIFEHYHIAKQIKSSFGKTVALESGGYLIIEHTEALHVIDVNSGHKFSNENQEETALKTNTEAVKEIARQLRLRDIGGIVVIDFIDMKNPDNKRDIARLMEECMKEDRAKHSVLPLSKFGIMQLTRQRLRPEIKISTNENCPTCEGTGKVRSTQLLMDDIEKHIKYLLANLKVNLELHVNPIIKSHLVYKKGILGKSIHSKWKKQYGSFEIAEDNSYDLIKYTFFDKNSGEEIMF